MAFLNKYTMIVEKSSIIPYSKNCTDCVEIKLSKATPYHTTGDGKNERMSRTIISMLKTLSENQKSKLKDYLLKLDFGYNSMTNKPIGHLRFFLMFGRSSELPIDSIFNVNIGMNNEKSYDQFVSD